jgi:hypothetical protein
MHENRRFQTKEDFDRWVKRTLDGAVRELTEKGFLKTLVIEAKPAWILPGQIMIGKVREQGVLARFSWFICGDLPTDHADSSVAMTVREAARYFALKWQLDAARMTPPTGEELADTAEALYELVDERRLWQDEDASSGRQSN